MHNTTSSSFDSLKKEMRAFYEPLRQGKEPLPSQNAAIRARIAQELDAYASDNPSLHPSLLKARQLEVMAEHFHPQIFPHSPFFFEMGLRPAENWGTPWFNNGKGHMGSWMESRMDTQMRQTQEYTALSYWSTYHLPPRDWQHSCFWSANGIGFDSDHHCLGYTQLLRVGVNGRLEQIRKRARNACTPDQTAELEAMERGLLALLKVAKRFAQEAQTQLAGASDPVIRENLKRIIEAANHVPANPPRNFYEGLAALWFLRETTATLEAIGVSVIGHPDRQLIDLYRADLVAGRLTEQEAEELVALWMLPTDVKTFTRERDWPETSTCMMLGGCDENGDIIWNELTRLFLKTHQKYDLINPKLNCRYSSESPQEYLELMAEITLAGHNHFAFLNDDLLIPANQRYGKSEQDARLYVNGGCQETMCEGVEHTAGAYFYYNMVGVIADWLHGKKEGQEIPTLAAQAAPHTFTVESTFEGFYRNLVETLEKTMRTALGWMKKLGEQYWKVNPCPIFSATLEGCIDNATDYTRGGAKYNPSGITLVGLGNVVNILNAIRIGVYEGQWTTLEEIRQILKSDWRGNESLRQKMLAQARYGHGDPAVDALTARFMKDIAAICHSCENERGSHFQPSFFVYYAFKGMGERTRATPDGRRDGEMFCQGIAPDRRNAPRSLSEVFQTLKVADFADYPGNAVLDAQLPAGNKIPPKTLVATLRTFARLGGPTLQVNCVSVEELRDAQTNPEEHRNLVVRISGLSACFVQLRKETQDEIISRTVYAD